ncbi:MAG: hypothetical protein J6B87_01350 [Clostridia bacterium]|nr:hypothetical protein [Clostridia bacterium]
MVNRVRDVRRNYLHYVLNVPTKHEDAYVAVMDKYGNEHWWNSDDPAKVAKYQMNESVLLVPFIKLQNSLESVLKRTVSPNEIHYDNDALRAEVEAATA